MPKRKQLSPGARKKLWERFNGKCGYCGCDIKLEKMQADHIVALSRGGEDVALNLLPSCRSCNHRKGTSTLECFREQVEKFPSVLARDSVTYKNAVRFGLVIPNPGPVKFYFERMAEKYD